MNTSQKLVVRMMVQFFIIVCFFNCGIAFGRWSSGLPTAEVLAWFLAFVGFGLWSFDAVYLSQNKN